MSMWVQKIDKHTYAKEPLGKVADTKFLDWLSATTNMGGEVILKETSAGVRYLSIDFAGIHPFDDLQVKKIKLKKLDGSAYIHDYSTQGNLSITMDCIEIAYETELEYFYVQNAAAFEQGYHYGSASANFQDEENSNGKPFNILNADYQPITNINDVAVIYLPGLYVHDHNMYGAVYTKTEGMKKWVFESEDPSEIGGYMREIRWADQTANDQYAYNVVPKPTRYDIDQILFIRWQYDTDNQQMIVQTQHTLNDIINQTYNTIKISCTPQNPPYLLLPNYKPSTLYIKTSPMTYTDKLEKKEYSFTTDIGNMQLICKKDTTIPTYIIGQLQFVQDMPFVSYPQLFDNSPYITFTDNNDLIQQSQLPNNFWIQYTETPANITTKLSNIHPCKLVRKYSFDYTRVPYQSADSFGLDEELYDLTLEEIEFSKGQGDHDLTDEFQTSKSLTIHLPVGYRLNNVYWNDDIFLLNQNYFEPEGKQLGYFKQNISRPLYNATTSWYHDSGNIELSQFGCKFHFFGQRRWTLSVQEKHIFSAELWVLTKEID